MAIRNIYPITKIDDLFDKLQGTIMLSSIDFDQTTTS